MVEPQTPLISNQCRFKDLKFQRPSFRSIFKSSSPPSCPTSHNISEILLLAAGAARMLTTRSNRQRCHVTRHLGLLLIAHLPGSPHVGAESVPAHRRRLGRDPRSAPPYDTGAALKRSVAAR